jgi:hypothetical protein
MSCYMIDATSEHSLSAGDRLQLFRDVITRSVVKHMPVECTSPGSRLILQSSENVS